MYDNNRCFHFNPFQTVEVNGRRLVSFLIVLLHQEILPEHPWFYQSSQAEDVHKYLQGGQPRLLQGHRVIPGMEISLRRAMIKACSIFQN
jgi:hypothetical protein